MQLIPHYVFDDNAIENIIFRFFTLTISITSARTVAFRIILSKAEGPGRSIGIPVFHLHVPHHAEPEIW